MAWSRFFSLSTTSAKRWFLGQELEEDLDVIDKAIGRGMRGFTGVVHVRIVSGTTPGDFLEVGFPLLIVSSKVLEIWQNYERFETYPVVIAGNMSPVEYTGVAFLGRGGPFDPVRSKAVYCKSSNLGRKPAIMNMDGLYFDDSQWDGSDLFTVDDFPCIPLVTERVVKVMKKAKVTNCRYIPLEKFCMYK